MKTVFCFLYLISIPSFAQSENVAFDDVYYMLTENYSCRSCHSSHFGNKQAGLDMDYERAYNNLVGFPAMQMPMNRVEPGQPKKSYLYRKLKGIARRGYKMPMGGPYLTTEQLDLVKEWILQGALKD